MLHLPPWYTPGRVFRKSQRFLAERVTQPHHPAINPKPEPSSANDDEFAEVGRLGDVGGDDAELASA